jgi:hypothetical protein
MFGEVVAIFVIMLASIVGVIVLRNFNPDGSRISYSSHKEVIPRKTTDTDKERW